MWKKLNEASISVRKLIWNSPHLTVSMQSAKRIKKSLRGQCASSERSPNHIIKRRLGNKEKKGFWRRKYKRAELFFQTLVFCSFVAFIPHLGFFPNSKESFLVMLNKWSCSVFFSLQWGCSWFLVRSKGTSYAAWRGWTCCAKLWNPQDNRFKACEPKSFSLWRNLYLWRYLLWGWRCKRKLAASKEKRALGLN